MILPIKVIGLLLTFFVCFQIFFKFLQLIFNIGFKYTLKIIPIVVSMLAAEYYLIFLSFKAELTRLLNSQLGFSNKGKNKIMQDSVL